MEFSLEATFIHIEWKSELSNEQESILNLLLFPESFLVKSLRDMRHVKSLKFYCRLSKHILLKEKKKRGNFQVLTDYFTKL